MTHTIAHRGASAAEPENTMAAFRAAVRIGCDGIETDVQLSADGVPVLIHDETLDRTTAATGPAQAKTAAELAALGVPALEELLALAREAGIILNLELKNGIVPYPGLEEKTLDLVARFRLLDRVTFSSFNHLSMVKLKKIEPRAKTGLLCESVMWEPWDYCARVGTDAYHPWFGSVDAELVARCHAAGIKVNPWTVDEEADIGRMLALGVDMLISNRPDRVGALQARRGNLQ